MKIKAQVNLMKDQTKNLKAFANITLDECFVSKGFKVMSGSKGLFVSMPSQKLNKPNKDGKEYEDISFPITANFRKQIIETILSEYEKKANAETSDYEPAKPEKSESSESETDDIPF